MAVLTSSVTDQRLASPAQLLLRRRATVYLPAPGRDAVNAPAVPGVDLLEADLIERGWLLDPALRDALVRLDSAELVNTGAALLADCDALLGADRPHVPLFRGFPASTPIDTAAFFVDWVLAAWFQDPDQPCVLCGIDGKVAPVNPCGQLVCSGCFDGADFAACPICHRRIDTDDPFLKAARPRPPRGPAEAPERLRVMHVGADPRADLCAELVALLARPTALPPADVDDLAALLVLRPRADLSWLPRTVPGRETKARLLAWLLTPGTPPTPLARRRGPGGRAGRHRHRRAAAALRPLRRQRVPGGPAPARPGPAATAPGPARPAGRHRPRAAHRGHAPAPPRPDRGRRATAPRRARRSVPASCARVR